jgi:hypothetical protein
MDWNHAAARLIAALALAYAAWSIIAWGLALVASL